MRLDLLLHEPGVDEVLHLRSPVGFLALHGGGQDRVTDEIACAAASGSGASLYAVVQPPTLRWHIPSYRYDPAASARLRQFLDHVHVVISVHGYGVDGWRTDWRPPGFESTRLGRFPRVFARSRKAPRARWRRSRIQRPGSSRCSSTLRSRTPSAARSFCATFW